MSVDAARLRDLMTKGRGSIVVVRRELTELLDAYERCERLEQAVKDLEALCVIGENSHYRARTEHIGEHARRIAASVGIEPSVEKASVAENTDECFSEETGTRLKK